jgi:FlaA1/EpsC-like NDP-sugar epimerase
MPQTALIIGTAPTCARLEQQLDLLPDRPETIGWVLSGGEPPAAGPAVLGPIEDLEGIVRRRRPSLALVCLPAVMHDLVTRTRTTLRRLGVPDRYLPPLEDQLAGIGPRSLLDVDLGALLGRPPRHVDREAIRRTVAGRRVLITGAGGSIGSELARMAADFEPALLVLVDRSENALFEIDRQIARRFTDLPRQALLHDIVDAPGTLAHFERIRPNLIFHAAAHKHVPMMEDHPAAAIDNNLFGTRSVADAADATSVDRVVVISTDKAVNPTSIMGATKRLAELYVQWLNRRSASSFAAVRFGNVLGSSGSVIDTWSRQIADGGPVTVTHPRMTRYFMTIPEAAALVLQAAALRRDDAAGDDADVYLLDMGPPVSILELARRYVRAHGLEPLEPEAPVDPDGPAAIHIAYTGPRPGEKMHEELAYDAEAMRPTAHPDINIWKLSTPGDQYVDTMLKQLGPRDRRIDPAALARLIRQAVPEMRPPVAV